MADIVTLFGERDKTMESKEFQAATQQLADPATWVDEYGDYLYRYALVMVRDKDLAEDLVQETFLAALQGRSSFEAQSSEKTWLIGILKHKAIDHYRKQRRFSQLEGGEEGANIEESFVRKGEWAGFWQNGLEPQDWRFDPAKSAEQNALRSMFDECLERLPQRMAAAFRLREFEQFESKDICVMLGISDSNLWVMLHRARSGLRRCIEVNWLRPRNIHPE